jgi:hypothetical protein
MRLDEAIARCREWDAWTNSNGNNPSHPEGLLRPGGQCGFLATNTFAQGDTREVGLDYCFQPG